MTGREEYEALETYIRQNSTKVIKRGDTLSWNCFYCNEKNPSASMKYGRKGYPVAYCAKCKSIYSRLKQDAGLAYKKKQRLTWREYLEERNERPIETTYNYVNYKTGAYVFTKVRYKVKPGEHKKMGTVIIVNEWYVRDYQIPCKSLQGVYVPGGLNAFNKAVSDGETIFYVEGEKDANTVHSLGYTSITAGGSSGAWQPVFATLFKGANVIILQDNDEAGQELTKGLKRDLTEIAKSVKVIVPTPDIQNGDISDYFAQGHTKEDFEKLICTLPEKSVSAEVRNDDLVSKLVQLNAAEKYETNDKGFGALYAEIFKDKHRYNSSIRDFMFYDGQRWCEDTEGLAARADAKALSDALVIYSLRKDTDFLKRVTPLCNIRNRENMLKDSKDIYYLNNEQLDTDDYLLNVQNGTLDLSGNTAKFIKHNPDMLLSKICNVEYKPAAVCKEWSKFLNEIMQGDKEKIRYLQKIAGLSLTGNTQEETCFILYGSSTRNGKSTFCETLIYLLGEYALTIKPETLAQKQNTDSRQASGDIARLAGCRFVNASEPPKRMLFDTALLKSMLGRDSITARHLYQREFSFIPRFKLVINTNYLPTITDDSVFSSGRINVISFDRHFTPDEQDKDLKNRLRNSEELSGILNWCIEGLRMYRSEGLKPPKAVQDATETYRSDSDKVGSFINECLTKSNENSTAKDIYEAYSKWCSDNGYGLENKGNFFQELKAKGLYMLRGTVKGKTVKNIVRGYVIDTDFSGIEDEDTPFI